MRAALWLIAPALLGLACRRLPPPPAMAIENALVVTSEAAPALPEAEEDEPASMVLRKGEVMQAERRFPRLKWRGQLLGAQLERDAEMIEAHLAPKGTYVYVFSTDVTEQSVPQTSHFCATAPKDAPFQAPCAEVLRRYVFGGDEAVGFHPCGSGRCGVAHAKGASVTWTGVEGLSEIYPAMLGGRRVMIATTHWHRSLSETGRNVVVLAIEPGMPKLGELLLDEIDSRANVVVSRSGAVTLRGDTLALTGTRREVDKTTGKELSSARLDEVWALDPGGKLAKR